MSQHEKLISLNVVIEKLYIICVDGRCIINAFYAKKAAVFATIAGTTTVKQLNYGAVTVHILLATRAQEELFGVKVLWNLARQSTL